jgi:hypothetical protein
MLTAGARLLELCCSFPEETSGLDAGHREQLNALLGTFESSGIKAEPLHIWEVANAAGLLDIYNVYYRGLSNDSAHPSVAALNHYVEADESEQVTHFCFGPDVADVEDALFAACTAGLYLITLAKEFFGHAEIAEMSISLLKPHTRLDKKSGMQKPAKQLA